MNPSALYRAQLLVLSNGGPVIWPAAKIPFWTAPLTQHPSLVSRRRGCDILNLAGAAFLTRTAGFRACRQFADQLVRGMSARVKSG
jgi:hypothetical protein